MDLILTLLDAYLMTTKGNNEKAMNAAWIAIAFIAGLTL